MIFVFTEDMLTRWSQMRTDHHRQMDERDPTSYLDERVTEFMLKTVIMTPGFATGAVDGDECRLLDDYTRGKLVCTRDCWVAVDDRMYVGS